MTYNLKNTDTDVICCVKFHSHTEAVYKSENIQNSA